MKKTLIILLSALVCLFLIVACGKSEPEETAASAEQQSVTDVERDEEELPTEGETPTEEPLAEQPSADAPAEEPEPAEEPAPAEPSEAPSGFEGIEVPADGVIRTAAELGKVLTDGDMAGNYKVEAAELDMTGIRYGSLGREDSPFSGTFDFGGCTLKGLYQPLFLYTNGATIDNLKIADTKIENDDELPEDMIRFGLVISDAVDTVLSDIDVADTVELSVNIYTTDGCIGASGTQGEIANSFVSPVPQK